ncbi:MAG: type I methionyl aminopeptidase [Verrucomicrobiae bacterium]|nr:type I methionyl aminopeptidase [Verrucomicrobiae bacterium]
MIAIRSPGEIEGLRRSCALAANLLEALARWIEPGLSVREIDRRAGEMIRERGAKSAFLGYKKFPGNICVSVNEEVVHGTPRDLRVQYGDLVSLDLGVVFEGWVGDTATTVALGEAAPEARRLMEVTEESLYLAIDKARPDARLSDVSHAVESHVTRHGLSVVREFVGHGIGRSLHEEPQIPNFGRPGQGPRLKAGMILAIEPMVNLGGPEVRVLHDGWTAVTGDGKPSAHFEHTVLVADQGPEILTVAEGKAEEIQRKLKHGGRS